MNPLARRLFLSPVAGVLAAWIWLGAPTGPDAGDAAHATEGKPSRPKAAAMLAAQAISAFRAGDYLRAIESYRQLTAINPGDALSWQMLGQSLAAAQDPRAAKQAYLQSLQLQSEGPIGSATRELLANLPPPDPRSVKVDDALTLADWLPLAEEMVRQGKSLQVLERNGRILAAQGEIPQILALQERLVHDMLASLSLTDLDGARRVIETVRQIKPLVPGNLTLLRYEAIACHMLGNHDCAQASYSKWMRLANPADPERGMISRLLLQARDRAPLDASEDIAPLGVSVVAMTPGSVADKDDRRLWVQSVARGRIGERLGVQRGDAIVKAGGVTLNSIRKLQAWVDSRNGQQDDWTLEVDRDGRSITLALAPSREELALIGDEAFRQYLAGSCESATTRLQQLVALQPDDALSWLLLGQCRQIAKDDVGAREAFTRAMELGKDSPVGKEAKDRLGAMPQPDPYAVQLDNGLTLGDWIGLQREQMTTAKPGRVLEVTRAYIRRFGPLKMLADLERDLSDSVQQETRRELEAALRAIRVRNAAEAEIALPRIAALKTIDPDFPPLLRLEARACHLVKAYPCAEIGYAKWLLAASADDPRRRSVIESMFAARQGKPLPEVALATGQILKHCPDCPEMIVIGPGDFEMGPPGRGVAVRFDQPFAVARTEVTQAQWQRLMGGNPSRFRGCGADCPVESVSWDEANEYVRRLAKLTGKPYRLPSEAEWEAACRAGEDDEYCGGANPSEIAWYGAYGDSAGNSGKTTHPVASRRANAWGFHDMSGNVREWIADSWQPTLGPASADGRARVDNAPRKVVKGGSWVSRSAELKASYRDWDVAGDRYFFTGFRVAVSVEP